MSFLDKLKTKVKEEEKPVLEEENIDDKEVKKRDGEFLQLDVDIIQTDTEIIVIAPIPGIAPKELDINIENENDVVTIQGTREFPKDLLVEERNEKENYLRQECEWGPFYRQIILPQEVNVSEVTAKFKKGILILRLPLLRLQTGGKKKIEINTVEK